MCERVSKREIKCGERERENLGKKMVKGWVRDPEGPNKQEKKWVESDSQGKYNWCKYCNGRAKTVHFHLYCFVVII